MFRPGLLLMVLTLGFCTFSNAQSVTVTFATEGVAVSPYVESGFVFTASDNDNGIVGAGAGFTSSSGAGFTSSYFIFDAPMTTLEFAEVSGAPFSLKSLDLGVGSFSHSSSIDIFLVGNLATGGTLNASFNGVTSLFSPTLDWGGLTSVILSATDVPGIDNILLFDLDAGNLDAGNQVITSALPTNQALNWIASGLSNSGLRDFSSRLHRVRSRYVPSGGTSASSGSPWANREVSAAASRYRSLENRLTGDTTINLNGPSRADSPGVSSSASAPVINDGSSFLSAEHPAGASFDPGVLAGGENWILWTGTDFGKVDLDDLGPNAVGVDSQSYTYSIGVEYAVSDAISLGVGWSHLWSDSILSRDLGSVDVEGDSAVIYATLFKNNLWADLLYSYGDNEAEVHRNTGLGTTVRGTPDIETHQTTLNLGYNMGLDGGRVVHGPTFGASYSEGRIDAYSETGDPRTNTQFAGQEFESLITRVGYQVNWRQDSTIGELRPQLRVGYGRENLDQEQAVAAALIPNAANNNSFFGVVNGQSSDPGEGWMEFGAGIGIQLTDSCLLTFDYETQIFRENVSVHYGSAMLQMQF